MAYETPTPAINSNALVFHAINYFNNLNNCYIVIGKTSTWPVDAQPPVPVDGDNVTEVAGYFKPTCYLCYKTTKEKKDASTLSYGSDFYQPVSLNDAYIKKASYVYYTVTIKPDDIPNVNEFRQVGLNFGVTLKSGASGVILTPSNVDSSGYTHFILNSQPFIVTNNRNIKISMLISEEKDVSGSNVATDVTSEIKTVLPNNH